MELCGPDVFVVGQVTAHLRVFRTHLFPLITGVGISAKQKVLGREIPRSGRVPRSTPSASAPSSCTRAQIRALEAGFRFSI